MEWWSGGSVGWFVVRIRSRIRSIIHKNSFVDTSTWKARTRERERDDIQRKDSKTIKLILP